MKQEDSSVRRNPVGSFLSALGGKILAGKKAREDAEKNLARLDEAALASREFGARRIADEEIKKAAARLAYEADLYIAAARESEGAVYSPLLLDSLDTARSAVNVWKKNENEAAAGKYLGIDGTPEGIVIPESLSPDPGGLPPAGAKIRERTLAALRESLRLFTIENSIRTSADPEAALTALSAPDFANGVVQKPSGFEQLP